MARIYTNNRNKYGNSKSYTVEDKSGILYPFNNLQLAQTFAKSIKVDESRITKFDSKLERDRYCFLKPLNDKKIISGLEMQVPFVLIEKQQSKDLIITSSGEITHAKARAVRETKYICDFVYEYKGLRIVEDTKSAITRKKPDYIIKKKLMLEKHGIWIREVGKTKVSTL